MKKEIEILVVPKWFDEWYKTFKGNKTNALYFLNRIGWGHGLVDYNDKEVKGYPDKLFDVIEVYDNYESAKEHLSKAILFGYELEQEPLYYAKIKGCDILDIYFYWVFYPHGRYVTVEEEHEYGGATDMMTKEEWSELGVNDTNADFERVEAEYEN